MKTTIENVLEKVFVDKLSWIIEHPEYFDKITSVNRELMRPLTMEATAALYNELFGRLQSRVEV